MRALVDSALCSTELCYSLTFTLNCACLKHVLGVMMKWVGRCIIFGFKFRFCCPETLRGFLLITLEHNLESSLIICLSVSLLHTHIHSPPSRPPQVQAGSFLSCPCRRCIPGLPECPIKRQPRCPQPPFLFLIVSGNASFPTQILHLPFTNRKTGCQPLRRTLTQAHSTSRAPPGWIIPSV